MHRSIFTILLALGTCASHAASGPDDAIAAAIADLARPPTDTARDINRKPAQTLAFAGV